MTDVFMEVLAIAASALAQTRSEQAFASWIASRDQAVLGLGAVGFDIAEMPWHVATFAEDRNFLIRSITAAESKIGWEKLGYEPKEDWLMPCLMRLRMLVSVFGSHDIRAIHSTFSESALSRCETHGIIMHADGCPVCNRSMPS
ncbi:hypothetical protein PH562_27275 [Rhizobium sp. CNPSo 4062]|uniref:hypothetical protein n=1 Tax=Rhizobium sp. CNPSo 4062 TaxID=3021410 RepID=UPI00254E962E|nr:hypothetical protein [Rhizobium sp. CNPSo 4062]MDK4705978.1 hypothetical protein [Rhizobium sp. CNPSo 4062]